MSFRYFLIIIGICVFFGGCSKPHDSVNIPDPVMTSESGESVIIESGTMDLDKQTIENQDRSSMPYLNVTSLVGSNFTFTIDEFIPPDIVKITLKLKNASTLTVHDVCIVFEDLHGKTVMNPDSYIDIFHPWDPDPFIAFRKEDSTRAFPPGTDTEQLILKYPGGDARVNFFIIAHLGGNTGGVYEISGWNVTGELTDQGGEALLSVDVYDHQFNVTSVVADTSVITGGITTFSEAGYPNPWNATISNTQMAAWGTYTIPVMAYSQSSPQYRTYNFFKIDIVSAVPIPTTFGTDKLISGSYAFPDINIVFTDSRSMASDGDYFYLVFCNMTSFLEGNILFTRSTDRGETWSPAVALTTSGDGTEEIHPSIAVGTDHVYIAYEYHWNSGTKVNLLRSSDHGVHWESISPSGLANGSYFPSLCVDKGSVDNILYVAYIHNESNAGRTWVGQAHSSDLDSWDCVQVNDVATADIAVYSPSIAFVSNYSTVMVCWENEISTSTAGSRAYFDKCHDWPNWQTDINVSDAAGGTDKIWEPRIAINPVTGVPAVLYRRDFASYYKDELRFTKATDRFATSFLPSINISDNHTNFVSHHSVSITCDSTGRWMSAFCRENAWDIPAICYFDESLDDGVTWGTDQVVNDVTDDYAYTPVMASSGRDVCVAWSDPRSGSDKMYVDRGRH